MQTVTQPKPFPAISTIPNGYKWTRELARKAFDTRTFIRVGDQASTVTKRRYLSGATRSWQSGKPDEQNTIFSMEYRITGTPVAVATALGYAGESEADIQHAIASAITSENYNTTMRDVVEEELRSRAALKQAKPTTEGYNRAEILWFAKNARDAVVISKSGERRAGVASPNRVGSGQTIAEKIGRLPAGKVLDVSDMDPTTGKGVHTKNPPKTDRPGKFGSRIHEIPIISNNLDKYISALKLAYGPDAEKSLANDIEVVRQSLERVGNPAPIVFGGVTSFQPPTTGRRVRTPPNVPGQTLARPPVFQPALTQAVVAPQAVPVVQSPVMGAAVVPTVTTMGGTNLPNIPALQTFSQ